jgi:hypothetical protein
MRHFIWFRNSEYNGMETFNDRIKRSGKRLLQTGLFFQLMEERLTLLEMNMRILMKQPEPVLTEQSAIPKNKSVIKRMGWSEFSTSIQVNQSEKQFDWKHMPEYDLSPKNVIEIHTEEANIRAAPEKTNGDKPSDAASPSAHGSIFSGQENNVPVPHWIRIRSPVLLKKLSKLTRFNCAYGPHKHLIVFIQPFKLLVKFADDILEHTKYLETMHAPAALSSKLSNCGT